MVGFFALLAGLLTLWGAILRSRGGTEFLLRLLSLAPLLLLLGALLSAQNEIIYHFSLRGARFDLSDVPRTLLEVGGKPKEATWVELPSEQAEEEPFLALGEFMASGAGHVAIDYDPEQGLSLVCKPGDIVAGIGGFSPENLAKDTPRFCHVLRIQDGDEIQLNMAGNTLSLPIDLSQNALPTVAGCPMVDAGGFRSLRAFPVLDILNQVSQEGCRKSVASRPEEDESNWRFRLGSAMEGNRLLLPFKSYVFWSKQDPSMAFLALLDPGLFLSRNGQIVPSPSKIPIRNIANSSQESDARGNGALLAGSFAEKPQRIVLLHRFHSRRFSAYPEDCGSENDSPLCAFFRVNLKEHAFWLHGETEIGEASIIRMELEKPAVVPVRDQALYDDNGGKRPVLFVSSWGGALNREEAQTTLLFPHQIGGFGPLRVRFDVGEDIVEVTAPNANNTYGESALLAVGARANQLLLGFTRYQTPWFVLWLFSALLLGRAFLLPASFFRVPFPRVALFVTSYLLALRALFGIKAYLLFPVDRESFEIAILGLSLVPAVLISAIAAIRHISKRKEDPSGPWGMALAHSLMCMIAALAYYDGFSSQSRLIFFALSISSIGIALLAPLVLLIRIRLQTISFSRYLEKAPSLLKHALFFPLFFMAGLFFLRLLLTTIGLKEAAVIAGNRVPFSIFHVPIAYSILAWLASVEGKQKDFLSQYRLRTLLSLVVLFPVVAGLTSDWGLMLLGLPPALLVLGTRKVKLARVLLVLLAAAVGLPKLFGVFLTPVVLETAGPERFTLSNGAYRLLLTLEPESIDEVGSVGSDRVAEHSAIIRRYAQGKTGGNAALFGDGYLADDLKPYGPAVIQTLLTDGVTATFLMPEFGIFGVIGVLLALGALLIVLKPKRKEQAGEILSILRAMMATYTAFAGFYMIAAPTSLVFFTGKNFPFLSIISKSDLLESGLFLMLAGIFLAREEFFDTKQTAPQEEESPLWETPKEEEQESVLQ